MKSIFMFITMMAGQLDPVKITGIIRHVLSSVGGIVIALGWMNEQQLSQGTDAIIMGVGGVLAVIAFIWSFRAPEKNTAAAKG